MSEMIPEEILQKIRDQDGKIIDPISCDEIPEDKVWILRNDAENIIFTSIETLYKNLVLNNSSTNPFDRSEIRDEDLVKIEEYGRRRKITVYFFDCNRNYNSKYRDTVYIFDWFVTIDQMFAKILKKTRNDCYYHKFEINGVDFQNIMSKDEIETLLQKDGERKIEMQVKLRDPKVAQNRIFTPVGAQSASFPARTLPAAAAVAEGMRTFLLRPLHSNTSSFPSTIINSRREEIAIEERTNPDEESLTMTVNGSPSTNELPQLSRSENPSVELSNIRESDPLIGFSMNRTLSSRLNTSSINYSQPFHGEFDGEEVSVPLPTSQGRIFLDQIRNLISRSTQNSVPSFPVDEVRTRNPRVLYRDTDGIYIENQDSNVIFSDNREVMNHFRSSYRGEVIFDGITEEEYFADMPPLESISSESQDSDESAEILD